MAPSRSDQPRDQPRDQPSGAEQHLRHLARLRRVRPRTYARPFDVDSDQADPQSDQESRSAEPEAAAIMGAMDITVHATFLPQNDPDAALEFYRDTLGFELRNDVGYEGMRWITVGPVGQPEVNIVLHPPGADPGITDDERRMITEMMAKGTYGSIMLATKDLDGVFAKLAAGGTEIMQEPIDQDWGARDCAVRDPAGNTVRIQQLP